MRESVIEKALVKRIKLLGGEIRKVQWVARHSCPDRFVMLPVPTARRLGFSRNVWVETKRPKKDANEAQAREHARMRTMGEIVLVIDTLEGIEKWFPLESDSKCLGRYSAESERGHRYTSDTSDGQPRCVLCGKL